jgi:hypothetical protein
VARPFLKWWPLALALAVALTSLALASVSTWLVAPYVALVGLLVFLPHTSAGARPAKRAVAAPSSQSGAVLSATSESSELIRAGGTERTKAAASGTMVVSEPVNRARRGRGRPKVKPKLDAIVAAPPTRATWVRVGPGKFVRVEAPETVVPSQAEQVIDSPSSLGLPAPHYDPAPSGLEPQDDDVNSYQSHAAPQVYVSEVIGGAIPALEARHPERIDNDAAPVGETDPAQQGTFERAREVFTASAELPRDEAPEVSNMDHSDPVVQIDSTKIPTLILPAYGSDALSELTIEPLAEEEPNGKIEDEAVCSGYEEPSELELLTPSDADVQDGVAWPEGKHSAFEPGQLTHASAARSMRSTRSTRTPAWTRVGRQSHRHLRRSWGRDPDMARPRQPRAPPRHRRFGNARTASRLRCQSWCANR